MLKIENFEVVGWEHAIRGMRNPKNSWDRSDSNFHARRDLYYNDPEVQAFVDEDGCFYMMDGVDIGSNDHKLMMTLAKGGPVHAKYRRMIAVYLDITAPLYWWKEFDTYKVGTVANSCSTMHKIHDRDLTLEDFSYDKLLVDRHELMEELGDQAMSPLDDLLYDISKLNKYRKLYLETGDKIWWEQMIQRLPTNYNQKRTVMLSYEVLANIYKWRKNHKLDEWHTFCHWIEELPYSELITGYEESDE